MIRQKPSGTAMLGRSQLVNAASKRVPMVPLAAVEPFAMQPLLRLGIWGAAATATLLIAVLASRSEVGSQRFGAMLASLSGSNAGQANSAAAHGFDAEAEARRLSAAIRGLAVENGQIESRVTAVERNMEDATGSIARQIEAVKTAITPPWPADEPPTPATPAVIAAVVAPIEPQPAGLASPLPPNPLTPAAPPPVAAPPIATPPAADNTATASPQAQYGIDVGSAQSIQALHARWAGVRSAHPKLFAGLQPVVTLKELARSDRIELRLVIGPLASADEAARLCASLADYRVPCRPTNFGGQHLLLQ
jgi:hypothetical protein